MRIRAFTLADYDAAAALWRTADHMAVPPREELVRLLEHAGELVLVAEDDDRLLGVVIGTDDGRRGWIFRLAVDPEQRRHQVGRALVDEVERRLVARGVNRIRLLVIGDNETARRFWTATGYHAFEDVVMYSKDIDVEGEDQPC